MPWRRRRYVPIIHSFIVQQPGLLIPYLYPLILVLRQEVILTTKAGLASTTIFTVRFCVRLFVDAHFWELLPLVSSKVVPLISLVPFET